MDSCSGPTQLDDRSELACRAARRRRRRCSLRGSHGHQHRPGSPRHSVHRRGYRPFTRGTLPANPGPHRRPVGPVRRNCVPLVHRRVPQSPGQTRGPVLCDGVPRERPAVRREPLCRGRVLGRARRVGRVRPDQFVEQRRRSTWRASLPARFRTCSPSRWPACSSCRAAPSCCARRFFRGLSPFAVTSARPSSCWSSRAGRGSRCYSRRGCCC